ncbi:PREDICTED: acyl-CoA synthetase short-chain family member 3, mitochondrial [Acromyrmex echinatior]|uniref:acyl-CoA synthetase short-chain family member 3, mitochondrial n=1 Tax=Acromyrmex echinatior TaxID=103372 RepID=UPI000580C1F8|nr:PREDICTED: acyl-CoA synthetase short-chain family member 3, mitochondrial [Acromyrmex echinatior]XP_011068420.1 PREDICTED: acyl-CoA synthetase short-chain family member 3, mitochondrial [Acromyrmex echinatior]
MLHRMNPDFLDAEPESSKKTCVEPCTVRSRISRKGDDNDYIMSPHCNDCPTYEEAYRKSLESPEEFWGEIAGCLDWSKPWHKVLDNSNEPFTKWFVGGELNACYNTVDRHVHAGYGEKTALIHDSPQTSSIRKVSYNELLEKTSVLAGALADLGIRKGDRVIIYMPLIPETIIAILATARLGAIHSVVFGGFAANELASRIDHAKPKVIIAASCGLEPSKVIKYTTMLNSALDMIVVSKPKCIVFQRRNVWEAPLFESQFDWDDIMKRSKPHPCVMVEANDPLYIMYTSGTTGEPKGILRPTGGHLVSLCWSIQTVYGINKNSIWWVASDMGWVVGHSYICYGPLVKGATSVMYEGKPDRTPDAGQYFRLIEQHSINAIFCVPTALRVIKRADPESLLGKKYSLKSLKTIFVAGEFCDYETKAWAEKTFKVPILNHWWQSETGHPITALCLGYGHYANLPKFSTGLPIPGYEIHVLRKDGSKASQHELGHIVIKLPLPPGFMLTLYQASERFKQVYFSTFPGYYDTMDAGYIDGFGYVYVTARDDDIINVAGHRISTSAIEDIILAHADVVDAAVVGVPDHMKGEVPLCLYVRREDAISNEEEINQELVTRVRKMLGPIASFRTAAAITALPRTRSGKTIRKAIATLARSKQVKLPNTIEDPTVFREIKEVLQKLGYAKLAPDPQ